MMMAVILVVVYIYIYIYIDNFTKREKVSKKLHSKNKECGYKCYGFINSVYPKSKAYKRANVKI